MSRSDRIHDLIAVLLLWAVVVLFFWKLLLTNLVLARGDTLLYIYPYWTAAGEAIGAGRLPLWNPDLFMGAPFLANSQSGILYPLNWPLWLAFDTPTAATAAIALHLCLAAAFSYGFARSGLRLNRLSAWLAAFLYALSGYLTAQVEHVNQIQGLAWLPAIFWLLSCANAPGRPLMLGLVLALQVLAGHTQAVFITLVGGTIYILGQFLHRRGGLARGLRDSLHLVSGGAVALLLAAAQILPTLELTRHSVRGGGLPLHEALSFSLHPLVVSRALLPGYGETLFTEYVAWLPLTALLLATIGAFAGRRRPAVVGLGLLAIAGLFFSLGAANPAYVLLVKIIPGFGLFRAPARWLVLYSFAVACLAGTGLEAVLTYYPLRRRLLLFSWVTVMLMLVGWALIAPQVATIIKPAPEAPVDVPATITLIGWFLELLLAPLVLRRQGKLMVALLVIPVTFLSSRALPYNHPTAPESYKALRPAPAHLKAAATLDRAEGNAPAGRFLSLSDIFFDPADMAELEYIYGDQLDPDALYDFVVAAKQKEILAPNLPLVFEVPAADGYDGGVLPLAHYAALERVVLPVGEISMDGRLRENLETVPDGRWLNLFNVRYLITDKVGDAWNNGVFYDLQHSALLNHDQPMVQVDNIPEFESTGLGIVVDRPDAASSALLLEVTVHFADGLVESHTLETAVGWSALRSDADGDVLDVTVLRWSRPGTPDGITLAVVGNSRELCVRGLSLVDDRDGTFQTLLISTRGSYRLVHSGDVKIYENLDVLPRAFLVGRATWAEDDGEALERMLTDDFDPALEVVLAGQRTAATQTLTMESPGQVTFDFYSPERIDLTAVADGDAWLLLSDAYYPGWEAEIDGRPVQIERADVLFRAVPLQSGTHRIVFSFRPATVRIGMLVSEITVVLCLLFAALSVHRRRARELRANHP